MYFVVHKFQDKHQYLPFATWREAMANCRGAKDTVIQAATVKEAATEYRRWLYTLPLANC